MPTRTVQASRVLGTLLALFAFGIAFGSSSRVVLRLHLPASGGRELPIAAEASGATWFASTSVAGGPLPSYSASVQRVPAGGGAPATVASFPSTIPTAITIDPAGSIYVAGLTRGDSFPASPNALQKDKGPGFVAKLIPSGTVLWATYLSAEPAAIAVDAGGSVYVTGLATAEFRATAAALKSAIGPAACADRPGGEPVVCPDAFAAKISADGSTLVYGSFLGGLQRDAGTGIAVARDGSAFVVGVTESPDFPTTPGVLQARFGGSSDAFAVRLNAAGSRLIYGTALGGSGEDAASGVVLDANLNAFITGSTRSRNFPVTPNAWQSASGGGSSSDAFYVRLDAFGSAAFASYLGGPRQEEASAPALLRDGRLAFIVPGAVSTLLAGRPPGPCEPASALLIFDPTSGRLADHYGVQSLAAFALAVDPAGFVHAAGRPHPAADQFALAAEPPGREQDPYLVRIDLAGTEDFVPACLLNAASLRQAGNWNAPPLSVSPGEIIAIFGSRLGLQDGLVAAVTPFGGFPRELGGVRVKIGGQPLPLLAVSTGEIRAVVPYSAAHGVSEIVLERGNETAGPFPLEIAPAASGVFTSDGSGSGLAAVVNQDGTLNGPRNPARRGSTVSLYATGLGAAAPLPQDGLLNPAAPPLPALLERMELYFAPNRQLEILFAGPAPGQAPGVYQVNARLPANAPPGPLPVKLTFDPPGWNRSQDGVFFFVE